MGFFAVVGFLVVLYYLVQLILPWFLDCDLKLAFHEKFGKPISSLKGEVVWIVGASSGIGEHLAYVLANAGCKIMLSARREDQLKRVKETCLQNTRVHSSDIEILAFDVCNLDMHEKVFDQVIQKFGKLDILVSNAGCSQRAQWEKIEIDVDKDMFDVNVFSHISLSRIVAKYFLVSERGHFVVTSSTAGIAPVPFSATYCATKHALHGYFMSFKIEKISPVAVTIVCPGPIQTDFLAKSFTEKRGEKYGVQTQQSSTKVSAERCATLMGVAMANKLPEAWIAKPFVLQLMYLISYYPNISEWMIPIMGAQFLQRLRDAKGLKSKN